MVMVSMLCEQKHILFLSPISPLEKNTNSSFWEKKKNLNQIILHAVFSGMANY